ncbi:MAG: 50S ribosomal protein L25 [Planctomycetes bacterium]|nr:50S ribosomal protein L25 [Planctomycetota bacterium]
MVENPMLTAVKRDTLGTRVSRRLRASGKIPCVLMHRKEKPAHLLIDAREFERVLKKGARILELTHPEGKDRVFIKEVQWDHLGEHVYHVDFVKVSEHDRLQLDVELVLKGKPVGVAEEGGVLDQYVKSVKIECESANIPDKIEVDVAHLKKDQHLLVKDIKPPAGVKLLQDPEVVIAAVTEHKVEEVAPAVAAAPGPVEPEVIKKEKEEEIPEEGAKKEAPKKEEKK